ncbi:hypothetical protein HPP92_019626 [Vanilla planifolia]|uniref:Uncharacterized protein n=1 Tax=Vanilla planifolia TaxID=51239 RepID=A0A835QCT6_VANPL|nr:hypothetical protein HPP92_019626 [Vanilla planifolia]
MEASGWSRSGVLNLGYNGSPALLYKGRGGCLAVVKRRILPLDGLDSLLSLEFQGLELRFEGLRALG